MLLSNPPHPEPVEVARAIQLLYDELGLVNPEVHYYDTPSQLVVRHTHFFSYQQSQDTIFTGYHKIFQVLLAHIRQPFSAPSNMSPYFRDGGVGSTSGLGFSGTNNIMMTARGGVGGGGGSGRSRVPPEEIDDFDAIGSMFALVMRSSLGDNVTLTNQDADMSQVPVVSSNMVQLGTVAPSFILNYSKAIRDARITSHQAIRLEKLYKVCATLAPLFGYTILPWSNVCFVCPRPSVFVDEQQRLHSDDSAAVYWWEGKEEADSQYYWHGVAVPKRVILEPNSIVPQDILNQRNAEVRRAMMYRFGLDRLFHEMNVKPIKDDYGSLYRVQFNGGEVHTFLRVKNGTPDNDGIHREYILPVPNGISTPHEAVAWTYNRDANDYAPQVRT